MGKLCQRSRTKRRQLRGEKLGNPAIATFPGKKSGTLRLEQGGESLRGLSWPKELRYGSSTRFWRSIVMRRIGMLVAVLLTVCLVMADSASARHRDRGRCGYAYSSCCGTCGGCDSCGSYRLGSCFNSCNSCAQITPCATSSSGCSSCSSGSSGGDAAYEHPSRDMAPREAPKEAPKEPPKPPHPAA